MRRQIEFLMLPDDMVALEHDLEGLMPQVIPSELRSPRLVKQSTFRISKPGEEDLVVYLARKEDLSAITIRPCGNGKIWTVDCLRSPVIEFCRCYFDGETFRKGRFFFDAGFFDSSGTALAKNEGFLKWAQQVFAVVRRKLHRDTVRRLYVGSFAKKWLDQKG